MLKKNGIMKTVTDNLLLLITSAVILMIGLVELYSIPVQWIIIISNIQIFILLFISYKYMYKGLIMTIIINLGFGLYEILSFLPDPSYIFLEIFYYRMFSIVLSALISYLAMKQRKYHHDKKYNSYIDGLTTIFNYRYFQERLDIEYSKAQRSNNTLGLIMIHIDNLKKFNDTYGHKAGDGLLIDSVKIFTDNSRFNDIVCRYSGDEFTIILPELKENEIIKIINKIKSKFRDYVEQSKEADNLGISLSIGYSFFPLLAGSRNELLSQADNALYNAKQMGRNNIKIYKDIFTDVKQILNSTEAQLITTLKTLLGTVSAKDRYTLGHSERVMDYAINIGKELLLDENQLKLIKISALLHDIGKVEIPQEVLNKKGKLTYEEFNLLKMHPVYSAEIIKPLSSLGKIYNIVKYHHERIDGTGYPEGLKGDKIPKESRILSVADAFDAMMSNRPYRKGLTLEQATEEIKKYSGTQFDTEVANALLNYLSKTKEKEVQDVNC